VVGKDRGPLIEHALNYWLLFAESHPTRRLFGAMGGRISALPVAAGWRKGDDTVKIRRAVGRSERCLWNVRTRRGFPVLDFPGRAATSPCEGEDGSRRKNATRRIQGRRFGLYRRGPGNPNWEFRFKQNCHNASRAKAPSDPTLSGSDSEIMHKYRKTWRGQECHAGSGSSCRG
jgi:hypothetical protein